MVSNQCIISAGISLGICIGFPILLALYFYKKEKISLKVVFVGGLVFLIAQPIIRIPILNHLESNLWFMVNINSNVWIASFVYAVSAGIFEECGRFIAFKYIIKNHKRWKDGIAFGIGHGGFEALYIALLMGPMNNFINMILINSGKFESIALSKGMPQEAIVNLKNSLISLSPYLVLMPGIERIFTIIIQMGLTMVVLYGVKLNRKRYLLYAIALHTLVDFPIGLVKNSITLEGYVGLAAVISIIFLVKSRNKLTDN